MSSTLATAHGVRSADSPSLNRKRPGPGTDGVEDPPRRGGRTTRAGRGPGRSGSRSDERRHSGQVRGHHFDAAGNIEQEREAGEVQRAGGAVLCTHPRRCAFPARPLIVVT